MVVKAPARRPSRRPSVGGAFVLGFRPERSRREGQSLVEFSLVLVPLMLVLLGIIQFGFIFNAYVTLTNATREGAREGTIYVYDLTLTKSQNDLARNDQIEDSVIASMNLLGKTAPQFATSGTWTTSGTTFTDGDVSVAYATPAGVTETDERVGQRVTVTARYHQDLIIPMIANLLSKDAGGRFVLSGQVTMVIN